MAKRKKAWPALQAPLYPPVSFTREELLAAIKKVKAARRGRRKPSVSDGSK
jgi:hypothetical protein